MRQKNFKFFVLIPMLIMSVGLPMSVSADDGLDHLAVADDISPQERFVKKVELTKNALAMAIEKAELMKAGLEGLAVEAGSVEELVKNEHLNSVSGYIAFYHEQEEILAQATSLEEVDALLQKIIDYREGVYAPSAKAVLEFVLVFSYGPSILATAQERYTSIEADVKRLGELNLIEAEQFTPALEYCRTTLEEAGTLQAQARELILQPYRLASTTAEMVTPLLVETSTPEIATTTDAQITTPIIPGPKELAEESLNKIRGLYDVFIETGQKVKEALGI
jgi:hypothetical protein